MCVHATLFIALVHTHVGNRQCVCCGHTYYPMILACLVDINTNTDFFGICHSVSVFEKNEYKLGYNDIKSS